MQAAALVVAAPLGGLVSTVCCQWLVVWVCGGRHLAVSIMAGVVAGLMLTLILTMAAEGSAAAGLVAVNLITAGALGFCYWAFLNLNITSLRIRILREMLQRGGGSMPEEELRSRYSESEMLERRLGRLLEARQIHYRDGRYSVQASPLLLLVDVLRCLRHILIGPRPGARKSGRARG